MKVKTGAKRPLGGGEYPTEPLKGPDRNKEPDTGGLKPVGHKYPLPIPSWGPK